MRAGAKQYAKVLYDLTDGQSKPEIQKSVSDFARYIYKERKLKLAGKIFEQFGKIFNEKNGIVEAEVVTREKISEALEKKVKQFVKEKYPPHRRAGGAKEVIVENIIDPEIKGGVIIKVGDEVMDGSINGKLNRLRKELSV